MDLSGVVQIISSVGFPIAACVVMGWYVKIQTDNYRADLLTVTENHKREMESVTTALNNNTLALTKLTDALSERGFLDEPD